jgi:hypothetical protein
MPERDPRIAAALAGELDAEGWRALAESLRRDPAARAAWWATSGEQAALAQALAEDRGRRRHAQPLLLRRLALAAGLLLAVGALTWLAWPDPVPTPTTIAAGADQLTLDPGARCLAVEDRLTRRWRLESGRIAVAVSRDVQGRGFAVETPLLLAEVTGTRFSLDVGPAATRLEVTEGAVLARAGGEELMVPAGSWAERSPTGWRMSSGLHPFSLVWDAAAHLAGQAPIRRGERLEHAGHPACRGAPGEETPNTRTIAIDLPDALDWRTDAEGVLELRYALEHAGDPKAAPRIALQSWDAGQQVSLQAGLPCDRPGQHQQRLAMSGMQRHGDGAGRIRSLIVHSRPADGLVLLGARILRP